MPSKSRGGLSKREFAKQSKPSVLKPTKSAVMDTASAKKAASSSVSKESKSLAAAQKEYIASMTPSGDELAATTAQQNLLMGQEVQNKQIASQTIASPFIERQTERLSSDTSEKVIPLKYQIAALQSQREARGNVAQAKAGFATSAYNRKLSASKTASVNPLDEEYKKIRNESAQVTLDKKKKGGSGGSGTQSLARSNAEYNRIKQNDAQRGFITLPKGVSGPPMPKILKKKTGRSA